MKIKDVADRTGFSAPTLRYYEEIGLLPAPVRTPAGYRSYDERTVERLAFIARAKELGCTLDEISDLITAWEGGQCGPIQDRLRSLVAAKLADARAQIADLTTLTSELRQAAVALERHRPAGPCDDQCGCVGEPVTELSPSAASITARHEADQPIPIACSLDADALHGQLDDWRALLAHASGRVSIAGGVRIELSGDAPMHELLRLVTDEQSCCQFMRFAITVDTRGIGLEVTAPIEAASIVEALFGVHQ